MNDTPNPAPERLRSRDRSLILVCRACEKRSSGPKRLAAKQLAKELRTACREAGLPKSRTVLTTCLGACPKKAMTVAAATAGGDIAMIAFARGDDTAAAVSLLFAGAAVED